MGQALKELAWPRVSYVVSTKFFWGLQEAPNQYHTLNRKYLLNANRFITARLQLDYVDLVFCHRPDPNTPVEETVWAMSDDDSRAARRCTGARPNGARTKSAPLTRLRSGIILHKPVMEQPHIHLFHRKRAWSRNTKASLRGYRPWADHVESARVRPSDQACYRNGVPAESRAQLQGYDWLRKQVTDEGKNNVVGKLGEVADELGCTVGQLVTCVDSEESACQHCDYRRIPRRADQARA